MELFENISSAVAVYRVDKNGRDFIFENINKAAEKIENINRDEVIGKNLLDIFPASKAFGIYDVLFEVWKTGIPQRHLVEITCEKKTVSWRENYIYKLPSGELVAVYDDLTEKIKNETQIRNMAEVVRQSPVSIIVLSADLTIEYVNPCFVRTAGYTEEESIGRKPHELMRTQTAPKVMEELFGCISRGETWRGELLSLRKNGTVFYESAVISPMPDDKGRLDKVIAVLEDITESKLLEEKMAEYEIQLQEARNIAKIGHYTLDLDSGVWTCSSELNRIFGLKESENYTFDMWYGLIHPEDTAMLDKHIDEFVNHQRKSLDLVYRVYNKQTNKLNWAHATGKLLTKNGKPSEIIGTVQDITAQKELEMKLKDLNENLQEKVDQELEKVRLQEDIIQQQQRFVDMGQMINAIAHQWRQPLNNINLIAQAIKMIHNGGSLEGLSADKLFDQHEEIVSFMSSTIDDFRNFFSVKKERQIFNVTKEALRIIELFMPQLNAANISLKLSCSCAHKKMACDEGKNSYCGEGNDELYGLPSELRHVFLNLLSNARDAVLDYRAKGFAGGEILFGIDVSDTWFSITVFNTGEPIAPDVMVKIFDPYFTTKDEGQGTGLGLYMSRLIVENEFHGVMKAENRENGVCFIIRLPRKSQ